MEKEHLLNLELAHYIGTNNRYDIPSLKGVTDTDIIDVDNWIGFNYCKTSTKNKDKTGVHFYLDDYQFERVWNFPNRYAKLLSQYKCVITPDFSMYVDMPLALQIYNHYRRCWLQRYWQDNGINVIPDISWSDERSFDWCFDGQPKNSIVSVSNVGCMQNPEVRERFLKGYNLMMDRLQPKLVLLFAYSMKDMILADNVRYVAWSMDKTTQA